MENIDHLRSAGCAELLINSESYQARYAAAMAYLATAPTYRNIMASGAPLAREYGSWKNAKHGEGRAEMATILRDFKRFIQIHGPMPSDAPGWKLDRIDNKQGYTPNNIRWSSPTESTRNRTNTLSLSFYGHELYLANIAEVLGISYGAVYELYVRDKNKLVEKLRAKSFSLLYQFPEPFAEELETEYQQDKRGFMRLHWILEFAWIESQRLKPKFRLQPLNPSLHEQIENANAVYQHAKQFREWSRKELHREITHRNDLREAGPLPPWETEYYQFTPNPPPAFLQLIA